MVVIKSDTDSSSLEFYDVPNFLISLEFLFFLYRIANTAYAQARIHANTHSHSHTTNMAEKVSL